MLLCIHGLCDSSSCFASTCASSAMFSCASLQRCFRNYLPNRLLQNSKNSACLSNNSLAAAHRWSCDSCVTSQPTSLSIRCALFVQVPVVCARIPADVCHPGEPPWSPHLRRPNSHRLWVEEKLRQSRGSWDLTESFTDLQVEAVCSHFVDLARFREKTQCEAGQVSACTRMSS